MFDIRIDTPTLMAIDGAIDKIREEKIRKETETFTEYASRQPYGYMTRLVKETGLGKSTVSAIYLGKRKASRRTAAILAEATGLSVAQIFASFTCASEDTLTSSTIIAEE